MGNDQDELERCVQLQVCDLLEVKENWWDGSHDWNVVIRALHEGTKDRLRKQDLGGRGGGCGLPAVSITSWSTWSCA